MKKELIMLLYYFIIIQDTRFVTSYKQEFAEPDNRKKQFINTAESLLNKYEQQEQYIN